MKKVIPIVLLSLAVAWIIIANVFLVKYSSTFYLTDGQEWTSVNYEVSEGETDKFTAELTGAQKLKVTYDGSFNLRATINLSNAQGETASYELYVSEQWNAVQERNEVVGDFIRVQ